MFYKYKETAPTKREIKKPSRDFWHDLSARICVGESDVGRSLVPSKRSHPGQRAGARAPPGVYVSTPLVWEDVVSNGHLWASSFTPRRGR